MSTTHKFPTMKTTITTTSINSSSIPPLNPKTLFPQRLHHNVSIKLSRTASVSTQRTVRCSRNGSPGSENGGSLKDVLTGMVDERVEQLLNKEENRVLLDGLEQASRRVEMARRELAKIEKQEMEAKNMRDYIKQLESRASEIAECQKEIMEAKEMVEEAERSLADQRADALSERKPGVTNKNKERLESIKAALIAAIVGTLAELPVSLTRVTYNSELILPLAITFVSCALFGVTFRYVVRRDLDDFHLKSGASTAFGVVKGLGILEGEQPLELEEANSIALHAFNGVLYVSESVLIFLFAGVALDFCIKLGILSTFSVDRSVPRT